jgi:hypothetical protein
VTASQGWRFPITQPSAAVNLPDSVGVLSVARHRGPRCPAIPIPSVRPIRYLYTYLISVLHTPDRRQERKHTNKTQPNMAYVAVAKALYDYEAQDAQDELTFKEDQILYILEKEDEQ